MLSRHLPLRGSGARAAVRNTIQRGADEVAFSRWSMSPEGRRNRRHLLGLRGRFTGRRAFIMGNGPSLLKADLNALADEVTLVSNAHYLIWDQLSYVPTLLAVEDRLVAEDRADELRALEGITRIFPFDLRETLGPGNDSTLYVNFPRLPRTEPKFSYDISKRAFWGGTVSYLNMQIAAHLGCGPIALIGFDHNYVVPPNSERGGIIHSDDLDVNHIHPDYFGPGYRWHDPNVERMERAYLVAHRILSKNGTPVVNATAGGHLEVFPRVSLSSLVSS